MHQFIFPRVAPAGDSGAPCAIAAGPPSFLLDCLNALLCCRTGLVSCDVLIMLVPLQLSVHTLEPLANQPVHTLVPWLLSLYNVTSPVIP